MYPSVLPSTTKRTHYTHTLKGNERKVRKPAAETLRKGRESDKAVRSSAVRQPDKQRQSQNENEN